MAPLPAAPDPSVDSIRSSSVARTESIQERESMHTDEMHSSLNERAITAHGTAKSIQQPSGLRMRPATHCMFGQSLFEDILARDAIRTLTRQRAAGTSVDTEDISSLP